MKDGPFLEGAELWTQSVAWVPFDWKDGETERQVLDRSVVEDVQFLRRHPLMKPSIPITGWVYDGTTGAVLEIDCGLENGRDPKQLELLKIQTEKRAQK
jgi:carbonic anhydrase